jgi:hypothetical protein
MCPSRTATSDTPSDDHVMMDEESILMRAQMEMSNRLLGTTGQDVLV